MYNSYLILQVKGIAGYYHYYRVKKITLYVSGLQAARILIRKL